MNYSWSSMQLWKQRRHHLSIRSHREFSFRSHLALLMRPFQEIQKFRVKNAVKGIVKSL